MSLLRSPDVCRRAPRGLLSTLTLAAAGIASLAAGSAQAVTPGLSVAPDRRTLLDGQGRPFYWLGDTGWSLLFSLTPAQVDAYLQTRKAQGFNVVLLQLLCDPGTADRNRQTVFKRNAQRRFDVTQPNPAFFADARAKIAQINAAGMTAAIVLSWGNSVGNGLFNADTARAYGRFVGRSFGDQNVVWLLGGDVNPTAPQVAIWKAMAAGVRQGEPVHRLMSYHPTSGSSSQFFHNDATLDFNTIQSGHARFRPVVKSISGIVRADYRLARTMPTADLESGYEHIPDMLARGHRATDVIPNDKRLDAYDMRVRAYQHYVSGAFGYTYGQYDVMRFYDVGGRVRWPLNDPWEKAQFYPGARQMAVYQAVRKLVGSPTLVPNADLVAEKVRVKLDYNRVLAGCTTNMNACLIYDAAGSPITLKPGVIEARRYTWIDPRTGLTAAATPARDATGKLVFTPPAGPNAPTTVTKQGQRSQDDWILLARR